MRYDRAAFVCLIGAIFLSQGADAQQYVIVQSNDPGAHVYADSKWIGVISSQAIRIPESVSTIVVTSSQSENWSMEPLRFDVDPMGSDTLRLNARFPYHYKFESIPMDVEVRITGTDGERILGSTPLVITVDEPLTGEFVFSKEGYEDAVLEPGIQLWNRSFIHLDSARDVPEKVRSIQYTSSVSRGGRWINVAVAGAAITGGVMAIRYRTKADRLYDRYVESGDRSLRSEIKRLDTYSVASLGAMQLGIGVFVFRVAF